jgi:hypothetical protein
MALTAGCGGGGGGEPGGAPPPAGPPTAVEVRGWSKPFGSASVVLGQSGFDRSDPQGGPATPLAYPAARSAVTLDGKLLVSPSGNGVSVFSNYGAMNGPVADTAFSFEGGLSRVVTDLSTQGRKLVVSANFLVLLFDSTPAGGTAAPQAFAGDGTNGCSESQLGESTAAYLTPNGRLVVADMRNHRVLIWNDVEGATGSLGPAHVVLGQPSMVGCAMNDDRGAMRRTLAYPRSVWSDGVKLVVADTGNSRVLVWDDMETITSFQDADHVIGQQDFVSGAPNRGQAIPSGATLAFPTSVHVSAEGELAVADQENSRVLIWRAIPQRDGQAADHVVGQGDFFHGAANDPDQTGQPGSSLSAKTLNFPEGATFRGRDLIVNDTGNHRVLVWRESD